MLCRLRPSGERPSEIGYIYPYSLPVVGHIMGVFLTEHPLFRWGLALPKVIGRPVPRRNSYHTEAHSMKRQQNEPNYSALVLVFAPGCAHSIADYWVYQVAEVSTRGLERTNAAIIADVEGHRDRTGLDYRVVLPTDPKDMLYAGSTRDVDITA